MPPLEYLQECFDYNPDTGELFWKTRPLHHFGTVRIWTWWNNRFAGRKIEYIGTNGYLTVRVIRINYSTHRIIWKLCTGADPIEMIDHIDGDKLNNKIDNLREASVIENGRNRKISKNNKLGIKGVHYDSTTGKYRASISYGGKAYNLGSFATIETASQAYQEASLKYHKEFGKF